MATLRAGDSRVEGDSTVCLQASVDLGSDTFLECLECENCEAASVEQQERLEREIVRLISQRAQMKSKISRTEDTVLGLETQLLDTKSQLRQLQQEETPLCQGCGQVRDPRHRKQLVLQGIYRDVLRDKPKQLLCIFGLFKRLEDMVDQGLMDLPSVLKETIRCCKCRQVSGCDEARVLLLGDLAEVLSELAQEQGAHNTLECSTEGVCGECLAHVERCLNSEPTTSGPEPPPVENLLTESLQSCSADVQQLQGQAQRSVGLTTEQEEVQALGTMGPATQHEPGQAQETTGPTAEQKQGLTQGTVGPAAEQLQVQAQGTVGPAAEQLQDQALVTVGPAAEQLQDQALITVGPAADREKGRARGTVGPFAIELVTKLKKQIAENSSLITCFDAISNGMSELKSRIDNVNTMEKKMQEQASELSLCQDKIKSLETAVLQSKSIAQMPLFLFKFTGEKWEDPMIALRRWEHELTSYGVPKSNWPLLIMRSVQGKAAVWFNSSISCSVPILCDQLPWDKFSSQFLFYFNNRKELLVYICSVCHQISCNSHAYDKVTDLQLLELALRAVGQDHQEIISLINKKFKKNGLLKLKCKSIEELRVLMIRRLCGVDGVDVCRWRLRLSHVLTDIKDDPKYWLGA